MKLKIIFQEIYRSLFFPLLIPAQWQYMPNKSLIIQILSEKFLLAFRLKEKYFKIAVTTDTKAIIHELLG